MTPGGAGKRCLVAYAAPGRQHLWSVEIAPEADVGQALLAARQLAADAGEGIPWQTAPVGIFGEPCTRATIPRDGDRIEIYRPIEQDPRERRRERAQRARQAPRRKPPS